MNDIAKFGAPTMSSREIAKLTEKEHFHVMRDVLAMCEALGVEASKFGGYYTGANGKQNPEYNLPKRETLILVSGYSAPMRARIIDRLEALENAPTFRLPETMSEALRLAADLADKCVSLEKAVAEASPKVEALERIAEADGSMCITDAAKTLQAQPKELFGWLSANQWIYRRPGSAEWTAYQDKLQRGVLEHKINTVHRNDGSEKITTRVLVTSKGLAALAQKMGRAA